VLEDREEQLILAGEEPVEGLQRDAGLFDELLCREALAAFGDQPSCGLDDRLRLFDLPRAGALDRRRPVGGALGPRERRRGARGHDGESTTTGIERSVRVW